MLRFAILLFASNFLLAACSSTSASRVQHDAENPVGSLSHYHWTKASDDEFKSIFLPLNEPPLSATALGEATIDRNNLIVQRMQLWASRLDDTLRRRYPGLFDHIPSPQIEVLDSPDMNAYVNFLPICFDNVAFQLLEVQPTDFTRKPQGAIYSNGVIGAIKEEGRPFCRHKNASFAELIAFSSVVNNTDRRCKLSVKIASDDNFIVKAGKGCVIDTSLYASTSLSFIVAPTADRITFYSGLLRRATEDDAVGVLYHELGHYYRAHVIAPLSRHGYFYHLEQENSPTAPTEAADLAQLNADLMSVKLELQLNTLQLEYLKSALPFQIYPKIEGQRLHSALFKSLVALVSQASMVLEDANKAAEKAKCEEAYIKKDALRRFTSADEGMAGLISPEEQSAYLLFEGAAIACLDNISLVIRPEKSKSTPEPRTILLADVYDILSGTVLIPLPADVQRLSAKNNLVDYLSLVSENFDAKLRSFNDSSYQVFVQMNTQRLKLKGATEALAQRLAGMSERAKRDRLGYYSDEQEADDLAAEWLALMGFDSSTGGHMALLLMGPDEAEACKLSRGNNWIGADKTPIVLGWGPLEDTHPNSCFRSRNFDMEVLAHGYSKVTRSPTAELIPDWKDALGSIGGFIPAESATVASNAGTSQPFAARNRAQRFSHRCRFAPQ